MSTVLGDTCRRYLLPDLLGAWEVPEVLISAKTCQVQDIICQGNYTSLYMPVCKAIAPNNIDILECSSRTLPASRVRTAV